MSKPGKIIITCAVTGSIHTPSMSPHLPQTPDEIAKQAIDAAEAGAAILHLHARDPDSGKPSQDPSIYEKFLPRITQATPAVINITTGGGLGMSLEERLAPALKFRAEVASLNMGSMNFGAWQLAAKPRDWQHDWERPYLEQTYGSIYPNTFAMIEEAIVAMGKNGTKFEFECYDVGHLYNLAYFVSEGMLRPPLLIQCILGVRGGIGAEPRNLFHMYETAERLFGSECILSCLATGRDQMRFAAQSALLGANVRVGLEDNLYIDRGVLARSNAEQVIRVRRMIESLGLEVASPAEAREALGLNRGAK